MIAQKFCLGVAALVLAVVQVSAMSALLTPLEIDNMPCKPEKLKTTTRYICDSYGNVTCQRGWMESNPPDRQNPCLVPVCFEGEADPCLHGECRGPDLCACEIGWEGKRCDVCVPLPGCQHGTCSEALACDCFEGWTGAYCDKPSCDNCTNGFCSEPNTCSCNPGWTGEDCSKCIPLPGCSIHGDCYDQPNTCQCDATYTGALCDIPVCPEDCIHGVCVEGAMPADGSDPHHTCFCELGYRGTACDKCRPYWACPNQNANSCVEPNQCFCDESQKNGVLGHLCDNAAINSNVRPQNTMVSQ